MGLLAILLFVEAVDNDCSHRRWECQYEDALDRHLGFAKEGQTVQRKKDNEHNQQCYAIVKKSSCKKRPDAVANIPLEDAVKGVQVDEQ